MLAKYLYRLTFILTTLLAPSLALADTFSATVPAGTEVVMQDPGAVIPVTITNNGPSKDIRSMIFTIDTAKYSFSSSTVPPAGWCVESVSTGAISFALTQAGGACSNGSTASRITPGANLVFNISVIPSAGSSDSSGDSFTAITVSTQSGYSISGALPSWSRRSFEASVTAAPSSAGVGDEITVTMQVTNRSTASHTAISGSPDPPSASLPIVTYTEGPYYASTLLTSNLNGTASIVNVSSAAEFPSSGTLRIGSEDICYSGKTLTALTGAARGCNSTTAANHSSGSSVYGKDSFSLAAGETRTVIWKYSADSSGSVYFTSRASNGSGTAKSPSVSSNTVIIGDFTADLGIAPSSVISGQQITAQMTVSNNGSSALVNIIPSVLAGCGAGALETLVSGPSPAGISSLTGGSSGTFLWTYQVSGSVGQRYCLSGNATANGPVLSNTTTSNTGDISNYSVTVAPSVISSGSAGASFTWTVYNGSGCTVREVRVTTPAGGGDWACASTNAPAGWSGGCSGTVQFQSGNPGSDIPSGGTKSFSINFSATETVASDKVVSFPVAVTARGCGGLTTTLGSFITVTANSITLAHSPAGPVYADGSAYYTMTAALTASGAPISGKTVVFTATNGSLSSTTAVTDSNGLASVTLTAPNSTTDTAASVTAAYLSASDTDTVNFNGWNKANLQYWGDLSPVAVNCGASYSFTMNIRNISSSASMTINTGSYFSFNDSTAAGAAVLLAYLDSPVTIAPGVTRTLTFGSATSSGGGGGVIVPSSLIAGAYVPLVNAAPPPASGLFLTDGGLNDQYRSVTDGVTAGGDCGVTRVRVIEWREM